MSRISSLFFSRPALRRLLPLLLALPLAACSPLAPRPDGRATELPSDEARADSGRGQEVALFAFGLLDTGYRFGGKNPEAGLDCSGMASYVFKQSAGIEVSGSAAQIARQGRKIPLDASRAGDLVFFNTRGGPYTHVGIYLGDGRFVHAPSSTSGKVRVDTLRTGYFAVRFTEARAYFD
jgi:cell wall-associated NlpC family hydrolase